MITVAAAPSVVWEELPAVTDPLAAKTGRNPPAFQVVPARTPSSKSCRKVSGLVGAVRPEAHSALPGSAQFP
jgi:hypothetical protein